MSDSAEADAMAVGLAEAAGRKSPHVDLISHLPRVQVPVRLIHGLQDQLIPYTEALRLEAAFPPGADVTAFITGLFAHSRVHGLRMGLNFALEGIRFLRGLRQAIDPV